MKSVDGLSPVWDGASLSAGAVIPLLVPLLSPGALYASQ
jgi:hypothetical protein